MSLRIILKLRGKERKALRKVLRKDSKRVTPPKTKGAPP